MRDVHVIKENQLSVSKVVFSIPEAHLLPRRIKDFLLDFFSREAALGSVCDSTNDLLPI